MLLNQVFDRFDHIKIVFVRKDGKLKKVKRTVTHDVVHSADQEKPLFPISKERS